MPRRHPSLFIRVSLALVAVGLMTAFSYPLMQEGYERVGNSAFENAQGELIAQSMLSYLQFNKNPGWTVETPTAQILNDLATGWDRAMSGRRDSFLPARANVETLSKKYRIIYKSPSSFKVVAKG